jgi:hypothetical protein
LKIEMALRTNWAPANVMDKLGNSPLDYFRVG